jgi:hypothetical protein
MYGKFFDFKKPLETIKREYVWSTAEQPFDELIEVPWLFPFAYAVYSWIEFNHDSG